jgi:hypothetical protein
MEGRRQAGLVPDAERELLAAAQAASERIAMDARLRDFPDRGWPSARAV